MTTRFATIAAFAAAVVLLIAAIPQEKKPGYTDTPYLPGGKWRVHDSARPHPRVVSPGAAPTESNFVAAPSDAIVLFAGKNLDEWATGNRPAGWKVENGYMEVTRGGAIKSKREFGSCQLHIEWASPVVVKGSSQGRGNSGVFLMGRYEFQVLDSFNNPSYPDGQAASIYGQSPPLVNVCRGPGEWQSYDIIFEAPEFKGQQLVRPARATLIHNGVVVHHAKALIGGTSHRAVGKYKPHGPTGPIQLQDHGNPVRYRNIWVRPIGEYDVK